MDIIKNAGTPQERFIADEGSLFKATLLAYAVVVPSVTGFAYGALALMKHLGFLS